MEPGDQFGHWTVLDPLPTKGSRYALARCVCGTERHVSRHRLNAGLTTSCGCRRGLHLVGHPWRTEDLAPGYSEVVEVGARFGRWTVLTDPETPRGKKNKEVVCQCDCGNERGVVAGHLLSGKSTSCGCLKRDAGRMRMATIAKQRTERRRSATGGNHE